MTRHVLLAHDQVMSSCDMPSLTHLKAALCISGKGCLRKPSSAAAGEPLAEKTASRKHPSACSDRCGGSLSFRTPATRASASRAAMRRSEDPGCQHGALSAMPQLQGQ